MWPANVKRSLEKILEEIECLLSWLVLRYAADKRDDARAQGDSAINQSENRSLNLLRPAFVIGNAKRIDFFDRRLESVL